MTNRFLRDLALCGVTAAISWGAAASFAQSESGSVERSGISAELKHEDLGTGNLTELNGKYKLRVASAILRDRRVHWESPSRGPWIEMRIRGPADVCPRRRHERLRTG
jgi:hypothetical protein